MNNGLTLTAFKDMLKCAQQLPEPTNLSIHENNLRILERMEIEASYLSFIEIASPQGLALLQPALNKSK